VHEVGQASLVSPPLEIANGAHVGVPIDGTISVPDEGRLVMDKLNPLSVGLAAAVTFAVLNTLCAVAIAIWPDGVLAFFNSFAHGLDLTPLKSTQPFSLFRFVCGLAGLAIVGFVSGAIFAWTYNLVARE